MQRILLALALLGLASCASTSLPKGVGEDLGPCRTVAHPEFIEQHPRACTGEQDMDVYRKLTVAITVPSSYGGSHEDIATTWISPGEKCAPLILRGTLTAVNSCERYKRLGE